MKIETNLFNKTLVPIYQHTRPHAPPSICTVSYIWEKFIMNFTLFIILIGNSNITINLLRERHCYPQKKEITREVSLRF